MLLMASQFMVLSSIKVEAYAESLRAISLKMVCGKTSQEKGLSRWDDGAYIDDYEYQAGVGDLDECNGMMINGRYGYFVTSTYPWMMKCFKGTPDSSFRK